MLPGLNPAAGTVFSRPQWRYLNLSTSGGGGEHNLFSGPESRGTLGAAGGQGVTRTGQQIDIASQEMGRGGGGILREVILKKKKKKRY